MVRNLSTHQPPTARPQRSFSSGTQPPRWPDLDAGAFAFVMAGGIVSVAAALWGLAILSDLLLAVACLGWIALAAALSLQLLRSSWRRPHFQAFAIVAATAVLGARFALAGEGVLALALGSLAGLLWIVLLARAQLPANPCGGSLLVVVAAESVAVLAALLAPHWTAALLVLALVGWALGLALYPLVLGAIVHAQRRRPRFAPDLWIVMGALSIATLAGAELVLQSGATRALPELGHWLPDVDMVTWSLATSLIAPLLAAELRSRDEWGYTALRWSFVFPLGMYAVASQALARVEGFTALSSVSEVFVALAVAAWTLALIGLVRRVFLLLTRAD